MAARERRRSSRREVEVPQDQADAVLSDLHLAYRNGQLRVLVGAGLSFSSGLPSWDALNERLLLEHLRERYGGVDLLSEEQLRDAARKLYGRLGRDGSADMVRMLAPDTFPDLLARALYGHQLAAEELVVRGPHLSLAAMARRTTGSFLFTTNFDPLMELALAMPATGGPAGSWREHRSDGRRARRRLAQVAHLHGWVDPDGASSPLVVLTESDYLELAARGGHQINRQWAELVNREGALLVLGMSLNDPNLRRFLHARRRRRGSRAPGIICVVFERTDSHSDTYLRFYWEQGWEIQALYLDSFDAIPTHLRSVAFGPGADPSRELAWLDEARAWVTRHLPPERVFSQEWQKRSSRTLTNLVERLSNAFQSPDEERLTASLFLPVNERRGPAIITRVATSRGPLPATPSGRAEAIRMRSLSVARKAAQGVAGLAFSDGLPVSAPFGSKEIDAGFSREMVKAWEHQSRYRDWRSIYAVPVLDGPAWLPVAVLTLTSSFSEPFWVRFTGDRRDGYLAELVGHCRDAAGSLIVGGRTEP